MRPGRPILVGMDAPYGYPPIPLSVVSRDTLTWQRALSAYPNLAGWALEYDLLTPTNRIELRNGTDAVTIVDAGQGNWTITVPSTTTPWPAGKYSWIERVTSATQRHTLSDGHLEVLLNYDASAASAGLDTRTYNRICLDNLEAVLKKKATQDQLGYTINGRSLQRMTETELLAAHKYYKEAVLAEERLERAARGLPVGGSYRVAFTG